MSVAPQEFTNDRAEGSVDSLEIRAWCRVRLRTLVYVCELGATIPVLLITEHACSITRFVLVNAEVRAQVLAARGLLPFPGYWTGQILAPWMHVALLFVSCDFPIKATLWPVFTS